MCSTLGVRRTELELTVREFTPAGEIIEMTIKQTNEPLEDQDIGWIISHVAALALPPAQPIQPAPAEPGRRAKFTWRLGALFLLITLLLVALFRNLPL